LALCLFFTAGCAPSVHERRLLAEDIARARGFIPFTVEAPPFLLTGYARENPSPPFREREAPPSRAAIYIEGDGLAWLSRTRVSQDPTPSDPVALRLAASDTAGTVIYLARPCQYSGLMNGAPCPPAYWTDKRFAPDVIAGYQRALDTLKARYNMQKIDLAGFSGGGAVAALLAESRADIASLRTAGGNLDHVALNDWHDVSQMAGSLNPIDGADRLKDLPQVHYSGEKDRIVPPFIGAAFVRKAGNPACVRQVIVKGAGHSGRPWPEYWKKEAASPPVCADLFRQRP